MDINTVLGNVGIYFAVISALAFGVERLMDLGKVFFNKHLAREALPPIDDKGMNDEAKAKAKKEELKANAKRQRRVRAWAIPIGIILAVVAQIDTFDILGFPSPLWFGLPILGWVISGLAASRGSAFWHDIIALLTVVKDVKQGTADAQKIDAVAKP